MSNQVALKLLLVAMVIGEFVIRSRLDATECAEAFRELERLGRVFIRQDEERFRGLKANPEGTNWIFSPQVVEILLTTRNNLRAQLTEIQKRWPYTEHAFRQILTAQLLRKNVLLYGRTSSAKSTLALKK